LQKLTDWRNARVNDYLHKATAHIVKSCLIDDISKVVVGDVAKSQVHINLGRRNNRNFVNLSLGQFVEKLSYKLEQQGIELEVANESYTSKASFVDSDELPKKYAKNAKPIYSGQRIKRGWYQSQNGKYFDGAQHKFLNADVNGAYNILRKSDPAFSFSRLVEKTSAIAEWLHPTERIFIK
jgi:putative transposase